MKISRSTECNHLNRHNMVKAKGDSSVILWSHKMHYTVAAKKRWHFHSSWCHPYGRKQPFHTQKKPEMGQGDGEATDLTCHQLLQSQLARKDAWISLRKLKEASLYPSDRIWRRSETIGNMRPINSQSQSSLDRRTRPKPKRSCPRRL